ncbi:unnamed protein product [Callosobruchus maculatus]|uniref:Enkurin domain-containing protein n=1 Tax=Callosobruchus maculatus TaxID=64391 RepID=A0A653CY06_CALMS|nr:unnamed protein product [Callosobruchus maculatus]
MRTKLLQKSKVTRSFSQKALSVKKPLAKNGGCVKKRIKKERCNTPERWSRRIRKLPPITIDVLEVRRRPLRTRSCIPLRCCDKEQKPGSARRSLSKSAKHRRQSHIEIVRVMPVVVYLKNNKPRLKALSEDTEIALKKKCSKGSKTTLDNIQKIKKECEHLEKKWSRILKVPPKIG